MDFFDKFKEFVNYYKINLIEGGILLLIILVSNIFIYSLCINQISNDIDDKKVVMKEKIEIKETPVEVTEYYRFDIKGAVNNPGVYTLEKGKRVIDAINIAGGLNEDANTSVNNLSKYIIDEMVIIVYTNEEVSKFSEKKEQEKIESDACIEYNDVITNDSCIEEKVEDDIIASEIDIKISINTANIELLMTLPGIGESKAKTIIDYREKNGMFTDIYDIMNVSGIGESLFEKIKDYITV